MVIIDVSPQLKKMHCVKQRNRLSRRNVKGKEAFSRRKEIKKRKFGMNLREGLVKMLNWLMVLAYMYTVSSIFQICQRGPHGER